MIEVADEWQQLLYTANKKQIGGLYDMGQLYRQIMHQMIAMLQKID